MIKIKTSSILAYNFEELYLLPFHLKVNPSLKFLPKKSFFKINKQSQIIFNSLSSTPDSRQTFSAESSFAGNSHLIG